MSTKHAYHGITVFETHICTDCAMWFMNRDDSGSADDWRERFESGWADWQKQFSAEPAVFLQSSEPEFRDNTCDICLGLPSDQYLASIQDS